MDTAKFAMARLRKAIRENRVSFPSQIPQFVRNAPPALQCHSVQLYFLSGWSCQKIAKRYGYSRFYIWQIIDEWKRHAVSVGYIQAIPPARVLVDLKRALATSYESAA
jgi:hypothetical protein